MNLENFKSINLSIHKFRDRLVTSPNKELKIKESNFKLAIPYYAQAYDIPVPSEDGKHKCTLRLWDL